MYAKVSRGFRPSCKNRGASALRGFCPTGLLPYNPFYDVKKITISEIDFFSHSILKHPHFFRYALLTMLPIV